MRAKERTQFENEKNASKRATMREGEGRGERKRAQKVRRRIEMNKRTQEMREKMGKKFRL